MAMTSWLQPALRSASTRCFSSCSRAVKAVRRISSAVTNLRHITEIGVDDLAGEHFVAGADDLDAHALLSPARLRLVRSRA
jgi:hypothetical protein